MSEHNKEASVFFFPCNQKRILYRDISSAGRAYNITVVRTYIRPVRPSRT